MGLQVTFNHPHFDKDEEFDLGGVALVKNGESVTLSDEQEAAFLARHGMTVKEALKDNKSFKVSGKKEGGDK